MANIVAIFSCPENGRKYEQEKVQELLVVGQRYDVEGIAVYPYSTEVHLKGFDYKFNSVFFDFEKDGKEYDPTKDKANWTWQSQIY